MKNRYLFVTLLSMLVIIPFSLLKSQTKAQKPDKVLKPIHFDVSKNLRDVKPIPPGIRTRSWKNNLIKNEKDFLEEFNRPPKMEGPDPVLQTEVSASRDEATVGENFAGIDNLSGVAPPDTDGDVSSDYYFQMINLSFAIWDKDGTQLVAPADNQTIWEGFDDGQPYDNANDGDPIVLYDEYADRWLVSQFAVTTTNDKFYELVAISTTNDPTGSWYRYAFEFDNMPDYPKFGVWPDGYYLSVNQFANGSTWSGGGIAVFDRDAMVNGESSATALFWGLSTSYGSLLPADCDGATLPPSGSPNYFVNLGSNKLRIWEVSVDWDDTGNSTATLLGSLTTASFSNSSISISQPGTSQTLDDLADRLMYRLQYRNFGDHQSMVVNHTVNAGSGRAGVRWYELRNTGSGWSIYQQGTYAPADGNGRWMGSIAMNGNGDIALGYSVSSSSTYPSIRVAGQTAGAPDGLGVLDISETSIKDGSASQTGVSRWGDYSAMTVDPSDDSTFWYTTEYSSGGWNWETQIASFSFAPPAPAPPVADFTADKTSAVIDETVSFSDMSTNIPTSWFWSFDPATVNYVEGTSSTSQNPKVQFITTGSYEVTLYAENDYGNDTEIKSGYITVTAGSPTYCTASGGGDEYIEGVEIGTISNTGTSADDYADYTNLSTDLNLLTSNDITITNGNPYTNDDLGIWIDWNHDGDFYDTDENVVCTVDDGADGTYSFDVPASALLGNTTMRIRIKYYDSDCGDPCGATTYGEVEDYSLNILPGSVTWDGTASSDWSDASNWSTGEVPTSSFNVTIPSSPSGGNFPDIMSGTSANTYDLDIESGANLEIFGYLNVEGTLTNNAGTTGLIIRSDASGTGSLITSTNNVDASIERYLTGGEWHLISASTDNQTIESLYFDHNPDVWLKEYNEGGGASGSWTYLSPLDTPMPVGKGFAVWVDDGYNVTPNFEGHLRSTDLTLSSLDWTDANHGYNLVGNPYPSAIDWDQGGWSKVNLEGSVWVYDPATGNYKTRNDHGIGSLSEGIIPVSSGFFVRTDASGGSITIPTLARVNNSQPYYSPEDNNGEIDYITVKVSDENNKSDEVWLSFNENCTDDFDNGWDVEKLYGEDNKSPQLYSIQDDYKLSINALQPLPEDELQVDLSFDPGIAGDHALELTDYSLPEETNVFLEDKLTEYLQDLISNPIYIFHANLWDIKNRFVLHFNPEITGIDNDTDDFTTLIYANKKEIYINHKSKNSNAFAEVYDLMGRLITAKELGTNEVNIIKVSVSNSHLIVRLIDGKQVITKKVFVQ